MLLAECRRYDKAASGLTKLTVNLLRSSKRLD
jgi:hypothetical protein